MLGEVLNTASWNRLIYGTLGVVLLKHAPLGIGPRAYLRFGAYDLPHAFEITGHVGATYDPSFGKNPPTKRFSALIDFDVYAGAAIPYAPTVYHDERGVPATAAALGFSLGAGFSF